MAEDYYQVLGVPRNASQADIQKAYRELARKHHPDMNPDDVSAKKKFQTIQAAFDVLNDPKKREMYDRYGSSFETAAGGGPRAGGQWQAPYGAGGFGGFEDVDFGQFFGERFGAERGGADIGDVFEQFRRAGGRRGGGGRPQRRGADLAHELSIPFVTAVSGGTVQLTVSRPGGKVESIAVKIPAGIDEGKKIRLRGQGESGAQGGTPGDILLTVHVEPHLFFHRQGKNLVLRLPVTLAEAALGTKVDIPTPQGTVSLQVPAGTSSGTKLRVRGHGVAPKNVPPGDLLAEVQIMLPKTIDEPAKDQIRQFSDRYPLSPRNDLRW
jgi:DnaJ-class molecular chaperone